MNISRGLKGHLRLVAAGRGDKETYLREQSFAAPVHLSKPYEDAGCLVINVVNPTAGYLSGDVVTSDVSVEAGGRLVVTSPSAGRAHRTPEGESRVEQHFRVGPGAWLEVFPELFIPQGGAAYSQLTTAEVEEGGEMLFVETLAPGRVASGEAFAFRRLDWDVTLRYAGRTVVREHYRLDPADESLEALRAVFPQAYFASCFLLTGRPLVIGGEVETLSNDRALVGDCALVAGGLVVKILAADSVSLRGAVSGVREILYRMTGRDRPRLRRF